MSNKVKKSAVILVYFYGMRIYSLIEYRHEYFEAPFQSQTGGDANKDDKPTMGREFFRLWWRRILK